ncbi:MAG: periplasmic heavy metal sensor [Chromatiaceae bacterium]
MLKMSLITLAVVGIIAAVGIAWARHSGYCAGGDFLNHITARVSRKLDLNAEQNEKLQGLAAMLRQLRGDWRERRPQVSPEIDSLLATKTLDRDLVMELLEKRRQAMAEHKRELVDAFADFSDSLRPEQRTRLAELITRRLQHRWAH